MTSSGSPGEPDAGAAQRPSPQRPSRQRPSGPAIDMTRPSAARVYDLALGGKDNYAADRELYAQLVASFPRYQAFALANRRFMVRAVRQMAQVGITQYLDLGTGIPTSPSVHEVARETDPSARVAYVDYDPIVMAHADALLARHEGVVAVQHDVTAVEEVLADPAVRSTLDFTQPIGLLCTAVLHYVPQDRARATIAGYRAVLAPGSHIALSMFRTNPEGLEEGVRNRTASISTSISTPLVLRTARQIADLFDGFEILDPGLLDVGQWTIGEGPDELWCLAGIGRLG